MKYSINTNVGKAMVIAMSIFLSASCMAASGGAGESVPTLAQRESRMLVTASILSLVSPTNCTIVTNIMTDAARNSWKDALSRLRLDGEQAFLPDFCKVKYTMIGGHDDQGFVMGLYNPFYDAFMIFMVDDQKRAMISSFRLVSRAVLAGESPTEELPKSCGTAAAVDYFPALSDQVVSAVDAFKTVLQVSTFREGFARIPAGNAADSEMLMRIQEFRVAMSLLSAQDKRTLRDSALSLAIVRDGRGEKSDLVSKDASTKLTRATLSDKIGDVRKTLAIVGSFVAGGSNNILLASPRMPTLMILAHVEKDARVWLRMFDAHTIVPRPQR